ncbi:MAG TPA: BON domain-containing protein [Bryobacteraceae bacterium]|jgi:osmotically-inducible protein OsmY|nr:BON domain-containing protein [Bryobacteraceae bacterium]
MLKNLKPAVCVIALGIATFMPAIAQNDRAQAPDNTAVNKQDRNANSPTADQGKNGKSDLELQKNIRHEVVSDKSISTYGHNVKIVASHGHVTLKGPVHSEEEKQAIEGHAKKYAGDGNVDNQITVKGDHK